MFGDPDGKPSQTAENLGKAARRATDVCGQLRRATERILTGKPDVVGFGGGLRFDFANVNKGVSKQTLNDHANHRASMRKRIPEVETRIGKLARAIAIDVIKKIGD